LRLQYLLGAIPGLLHGEVRSALVVGLGTGMTAASLAALPGLGRLDVFEICRAMPEGARAFADFNGGLLDDPRVALRVADGRHELARSSARWDLVTADPIHPWTRGSNDLYSLEHFQSMRAHLAPGGIASQWLPLYQLASEDVRLIAATWCAAFPHTSAWLTAYDLVLVGAAEPGPAERDLCRTEIPPGLAMLLARAGVRSGAEIAALQVAGDAALRAFAAGAAPMRDDRPVLEFRSPRHALGGYAEDVLGWAGREAFVASLPTPAQARAREVRVLLARFLEESKRGLGPAVDAYGRALLALPPLR
jgi:spermidine synthase